MSRAKTAIVALVAVLTCSAAVTSAAPAALWYVNGSHLNDPTTLAASGTVDSEIVLNIPNTRIKVTCISNSSTWHDSEVVPPNEILVELMELRTCEVAEPAACTLSGQPVNIRTTPLKAVVTKGTTPADKVTFLPRTGTLFTELTFESGTCALEGIQPVRGQVTLNMPAGQNESTLQAFEGLGTVENNSLTIGAGSRLYLEGGRQLVYLASESKWSFH